MTLSNDLRTYCGYPLPLFTWHCFDPSADFYAYLAVSISRQSARAGSARSSAAVVYWWDLFVFHGNISNSSRGQIDGRGHTEIATARLKMMPLSPHASGALRQRQLPPFGDSSLTWWYSRHSLSFKNLDPSAGRGRSDIVRQGADAGLEAIKDLKM